MSSVKKHKKNMKRKSANATGIPTTRSGRKRKMNSLQSQVIFGLIVVGIVLYLIARNI
ncbi:hypothetical protein [Marinobacterium rhizophilum]|uniref:Uncharacterized protein n=1 Tax=Marinobacterium rhizophilum TaxID=420402 RepID=A0ABY5HN43_9GAMM|nr:hypothetical protein [Marinobacterium rhizophilum]UTW13830.1 hypothetical protein KDW95_09415 [Marinobacterium rhizophilum]